MAWHRLLAIAHPLWQEAINRWINHTLGSSHPRKERKWGLEKEAVCQRVLPGVYRWVHTMQNHKENHFARQDDQDQLHNESFWKFTIHSISADQQCFKTVYGLKMAQSLNKPGMRHKWWKFCWIRLCFFIQPICKYAHFSIWKEPWVRVF